MKKSVQLYLIVTLVIGLAGCGITSSETVQQQSAFKQNFSIGPLVNGHQELLLEGSRTLSGMEAGPQEPFTQSHEYMALQVDTHNTSALMEALQSDIGEIISTSGATIVGGAGSDTQADPVANFSYDYKEGPFYGVINVWGLHGEGTTFVIISQITESKTKNE